MGDTQVMLSTCLPGLQLWKVVDVNIFEPELYRGCKGLD